MKKDYRLDARDAEIVATWLDAIAGWIANGDLGTCGCENADGSPAILGDIRRIRLQLPLGPARHRP